MFLANVVGFYPSLAKGGRDTWERGYKSGKESRSISCNGSHGICSCSSIVQSPGSDWDRVRRENRAVTSLKTCGVGFTFSMHYIYMFTYFHVVHKYMFIRN